MKPKFLTENEIRAKIAEFESQYENEGGHVFYDRDFEGVHGIFVKYVESAYGPNEKGWRDRVYLLHLCEGEEPQGGTMFTMSIWRPNPNVSSEFQPQTMAIHSENGLVDMG